jgi:hypothetical protein
VNPASAAQHLDVRGGAEDARADLLSNPFITDITVMSAAIPSAMPSIEMSEMKEMKWVRRLARV